MTEKEFEEFKKRFDAHYCNDIEVETEWLDWVVIAFIVAMLGFFCWQIWGLLW